MARLSEWCSVPEVHLPRSPSHDFLQRLDATFLSYASTIAGLDPGPLEDQVRSESPNIVTLSNDILQAIREYLLGHPGKAYTSLEHGLSAVRPHINALQVGTPGATLPPVYRIRISAAPKRFTARELFHIPFELRRLVSPQRFSIPGLPSLYLGGSAYVCWEELGRPPSSAVYIAQFRFQRPNIPLLDMTYLPCFLEDYIVNCAKAPDPVALEAKIVAAVVCWPLLAACMTQAHDNAAPFKPEYIIPQLLLQWVTQETSWAGIRYFSTKVGNPANADLGSNLVLPVQTLAETGLCPTLVGLFEVTSPWNWETALSVNVPMSPTDNKGNIEPAHDAFVDYAATQFWRIESMLNVQIPTRV